MANSKNKIKISHKIFNLFVFFLLLYYDAGMVCFFVLFFYIIIFHIIYFKKLK